LAPDDDATWLVLGDALHEAGDPAGELIMLESRRYHATSDEVTTIDQRLAVLGEIVPDAELLADLFRPPDPILPFIGGGHDPVRYDLQHKGVRHQVIYSRGQLEVRSDDERREWQLGGTLDGTWSPEETNVYLLLISAGIDEIGFDAIAIPQKTDVGSHPFYRRGLLPRLPVPRCRTDHVHTARCESDRAMPAYAEPRWRWLIRRTSR
jgi:hypothetical protein